MQYLRMPLQNINNFNLLFVLSITQNAYFTIFSDCSWELYVFCLCLIVCEIGIVSLLSFIFSKNQNDYVKCSLSFSNSVYHTLFSFLPSIYVHKIYKYICFKVSLVMCSFTYGRFYIMLNNIKLDHILYTT